MIRSLLTTAGTCTFALIILACAVAAYNGVGHTVGSLPGHVWNFRGSETTSTPSPTFAAGVVHQGASSIGPLTPTPAPAVPPVNPLEAECSWAADTLRADSNLDAAGARHFPEFTEYYMLWSGRWAQLAEWISTQCGPAWWPASRCTKARGWIAFGISTHEATGSAVPHDAANDAHWIAAYKRVDALLQEVCG